MIPYPGKVDNVRDVVTLGDLKTGGPVNIPLKTLKGTVPWFS